VQPNIEPPTVLGWTFKIEQEVAPHTALGVGYVGSHSYHQILSLDQNTPSWVICPDVQCPAGVPNGGVYYTSTRLANPHLANSTSWISAGISNYNALEVDVRKQYANGFQLRGVYTWSRNLDDGSAWNTSVSSNTPAYVSFPGNPRLDYGRAATDVTHSGAINGSWDLPFGKDRAFFHGISSREDRFIGGWSLSGIVSVQSGFPFSPQLGYNPSGNGDTRNPVRPSLNPSYHGTLYPRTPQQWFDPNAFMAPIAGTLGNAGRDTLVGPGLVNADLSLAKTTTVTEHLRAQFRVEYFNIANHTNFTTPNAVVFSTGPTPAKPATSTALSPTAGVLTGTATTSRQLQFALKFLF
jgi:hypothetical protein